MCWGIGVLSKQIAVALIVVCVPNIVALQPFSVNKGAETIGILLLAPAVSL